MKNGTRTKTISRKGAKHALSKVEGGARGNKNSDKSLKGEFSVLAGGVEPIAAIKNAAGIILGVTENRTWIELFFEGDLMHTKTVNLPSGSMFDIYVENIPHKTTVYEHPRTMIYFHGPCDLAITRDGNKVIVMGSPLAPAVG